MKTDMYHSNYNISQKLCNNGNSFDLVYLVAELDTIKLVGVLQKFWSECGSNELCVV